MIGYRKRKRLLPWLFLNIGRRGPSLSVKRGRWSASTRGTVSTSRRGFFWRKRVG